MAVEAVNSTQITNDIATPVVFNSPHTTRGAPEELVAKVVMALDASATSTYRLFRVKSSDRVKSLRLAHTIGTSSVGRDNDFGLYGVNGGAVVNVNLFADAISFVTARDAWTELLPAEGGAGIGVTDCEKRIWELLALTADPMIEYDVVITCNEANTTLAITIGVQMTVVR